MKLRTGSSETCLQLVGGVRGETAHNVGCSPGVAKACRNPFCSAGPPGPQSTLSITCSRFSIWSE
jgi:hypothetical protein